MPPSSWRSPDDLTDIDTPDGLYCKLPQDSPLSVRGARNYPCMGHPGKRAPTVEICNSDKPFMPLAMRQHTLGPSPLDPNLLAQGVPPDDRITSNDRIFGPLEGTPLPPGAVPRGAPAGPRGENPPPGTVGAAVPPVPSSGPRLAPMSPMSADLPPIAPLDMPAPGQLPAPLPPPPPAPAAQDQVDGGQPQAAPSSFGANASRPAPSVVVAKYDPRTGRYIGPDGKLYQQSDLVTSKAPKTWKDMHPT
jgi:phospholipid/cholesterol/gamma-HCH transport system substrate-binding protein